MQRLYTLVGEQWPRAYYLALSLAFAWVDILLFSSTVFPSTDDGSTLQPTTILLSTVAMCATVILLFCVAPRLRSYFPLQMLGMITAVAAVGSAGMLYVVPRLAMFALWQVGGALLSGVATAGLFVLTIAMILRVDVQSLFDVCIDVGLSRIFAGFIFFLALGLPEEIRIVCYGLLPLMWLFFMGLGSYGDGQKGAIESTPTLTLSRKRVLGRLLLLLGLLFFVASLPGGRADATYTVGERLLSGQMVMLLTMLFCGVLVALLVLRKEQFRFILISSFYAAACVLLVVFMSTPFAFTEFIGEEWIASSLRNLVDVLSLMLLVAVVRLRGLAILRSVALFYGVKFIGCLAGIVAASVAGDAPLFSSAAALATLLLLAATLLTRDMEETFGGAAGRTSIDGSASMKEGSGDVVRQEHLHALAQDRALSQRETEVFVLLCQGYSAKVISEKLVLSPNTIKTHVRSIYVKTGVSSRDELLLMVNESFRESPDENFV